MNDTKWDGVRPSPRNRPRARPRRGAGAGTVLLAGLVASLLISGCADASRAPKVSLKKFLKAVAAGDLVASYQYLSSADRAKMDLAAWSRDEEKMAHGATGGRFHFIMSDAIVTGDSATVEVLIGDDADTGNAQDLKFLMVKEGGSWKVSFLKTAAGPVRHVETGGGINWSNVAFGSGSESTARTVIHLVMLLAVYAFFGIGLQRTARVKKLPHPWFAWVPVLNIYTAWKIAGKGAFSTVLSLIPVVNIVMYVLFCFRFSRACGKGRLYGFLQLIPVVNLVVFWLLVESAEDAAASTEDRVVGVAAPGSA
jgi:hypothetical protein